MAQKPVSPPLSGSASLVGTWDIGKILRDRIQSLGNLGGYVEALAGCSCTTNTGLHSQDWAPENKDAERGMQTKRISQGFFFCMNLKVPETSW